MILQGDCRETLRTLASGSVHCCVTSPPYFGLRDYDCDGQMGLEPTPDEYITGMVEVFREVRRVLRDDGTLWLNIGDSYAGSWGAQSRKETPATLSYSQVNNHPKRASNTGSVKGYGCKPKDLIGIPWMLAFALRADGWYLRQEIIWHKPNPMPESVRDRCTKAHEQIFLLSKSPRYYFDAEAIKENSVDPKGSAARYKSAFGGAKARAPVGDAGIDTRTRPQGMRDFSGKRNKRSVWTVTTKSFKDAHFATFPPDLIEPCIRAGCPIGGTVLDPFFGAGTTGLVAERRGRQWIGCELNPKYITMAERRIVTGRPKLVVDDSDW